MPAVYLVDRPCGLLFFSFFERPLSPPPPPPRRFPPKIVQTGRVCGVGGTRVGLWGTSAWLSRPPGDVVFVVECTRGRYFNRGVSTLPPNTTPVDLFTYGKMRANHVFKTHKIRSFYVTIALSHWYIDYRTDRPVVELKITLTWRFSRVIPRQNILWHKHIWVVPRCSVITVLLYIYNVLYTHTAIVIIHYF